MAFWDCSTKTKKWFEEVLNTVPNTGATQWDHLGLNGKYSYASGDNNKYIAPSFITADGMAWVIYGSTGKCTIIIDVNGEKEPNATGIDQIAFQVGKSDNGVDYGVYPKGTPSHSADQGWCTYKVIQTGKMPWLRDVGNAETCGSY